MHGTQAGQVRDESHGFSLVELAVVIAVLSGLLYFLLDRVLYMQEMAEKTEVEETVRSINYALRLEAASRMARGSENGQALLEKENPVKWLATQPRNYLGEHSQAPRGARPAYWFYDPLQHHLIYRPNRSDNLVIEKGKERELRFVVRTMEGEPSPALEPLSRPIWFGEKVTRNR
ncbi:MAG: type II secretion system protein [Sterolibacterium sp.]